MKVIHICGESAVGENRLQAQLKSIEARQELPNLLDDEIKLLSRFEIRRPFTVLKPECAMPGIPLAHLRDEFNRIIEENEYETLVHHWEYASQSIFYLLNYLDLEIHQKIFNLCKNPAEHLGDLHDHPGEFGKEWNIEKLKNEFVKIYNLLHPVIKDSHRYGFLKKSDSNAETLDVNQGSYQEIAGSIEVEVVDLSSSDYCTISGAELGDLLLKNDG